MGLARYPSKVERVKKRKRKRQKAMMNERRNRTSMVLDLLTERGKPTDRINHCMVVVDGTRWA
jgi:hypothetical protein